jgi:hypothetical protein
MGCDLRFSREKGKVSFYKKCSGRLVADFTYEGFQYFITALTFWIKEVVGSWFKHNDDLTHRECDILNSIAKCYKGV